MNTPAGLVKVWDLFIRLFHWTVAVGFFIAYVTDDLLILHVWAGYVIGGLLVLRIVWGVIGSRHARFVDFVYRPAKVTAYLRDLIGFRAKRYLGHSPAAGAMAVMLMLGLAVTVWTGLELYAAEENAGPLAAASTEEQQMRLPVVLVSRDQDEAQEKKNENNGGGIWEELHEAVANLTLILVLVHIAGVLFTSVVHRENLAKAMVTGYKRAN
jgi:cytochrome b